MTNRERILLLRDSKTLIVFAIILSVNNEVKKEILCSHSSVAYTLVPYRYIRLKYSSRIFELEKIRMSVMATYANFLVGFLACKANFNSILTKKG